MLDTVNKPAKSAWLTLAAALAVLALCRPAQALPAANAYAPDAVGAFEPNSWEADLLARIQTERRRRGLAPLRRDDRLSAVARQHSGDMARHGDFDDVSPRLGTFEYRLHRAGASLPNLRHAIFRHRSADALLGQMARQADPPHLSRATHVGLGVARRGRRGSLHATIVLVHYRTELDPFPTMPLYGRRYRLSGRVDEGYSGLSLVMTLPNGETVDAPIEVGPGRRFETIVAFDRGRGRYVVEIMGRGELGPVVLDLMNCYAGVPYPPPDFVRDEATPPDLRRAERDMVAMINRERRQAGLGVLVLDARLAAVARAHSADMAANGFFAHVSPRQGDLDDRMRRAGLTARAFSENIAQNRSLSAAHRGLMDSPAHRRGILNPDMTHVGVGIVHDGKGGLLITQNFSRAFVRFDGERLAADLVRSINEVRRRNGLRPLRSDGTFARIARENSRAMEEAGSVSHDRAMESLRRSRLAQAVQVAVLMSADPPNASHFEKAASGDYNRIGAAVVQTQAEGGSQPLWTTVLFSK